MYSITVREHIMIAHSLRGDVFGPAQQLHGATCIVVDIGRTTAALKEVLGGLSYRNLDDDPELKGQNTTTEFLARLIFDRLVAAISRGDLGPGGRDIESIRV